MIRHTVVFKVKPSVSKEAIFNAFQHLFALKNTLPGILSIAGGETPFHEGKGSDYITHGFSIDFEDEEAYTYFLEDPVTDPAKICITNIAVNGVQGLYGFDMGNERHVFPNPLDKYRIPTPRLVPRGAR